MIDPTNRFTVLRCDRESKNGGGVCVLISNDIRSHRIELSPDELVLLHRSQCELLCCDVILGATKYRLVTVYRPPCSSLINRYL